MDELFFLINNMPILKLTNQEWDILDDIFSSLEEKSLTEFKKKWDALVIELKELPIKSVYFSDIGLYLESWFKMTSLLVKFNQNTAFVWKETYKEPLGADELLDLTIELLPTNLFTLKLSLSKLEKAALIDGRSEKGFSLTVLYSAIQIKIQRIELNKNLLQPSDYADKILTVANKIKQKRYLLILTKLCENFIETLGKDIIKIIKDNDSIGYNFLLHSNPGKSGEEIILDIIDRIEHHSSTLSCLKLINSHIQRYLLTQDFIWTLKRSRYTNEERLIEFKEKFLNFIFYIRSNPQNETGFFLRVANDLLGSYSFFSSTTEDQFILSVNQIIEKYKSCLPQNSPVQPLKLAK